MSLEFSFENTKKFTFLFFGKNGSSEYWWMTFDSVVNVPCFYSKLHNTNGSLAPLSASLRLPIPQRLRIPLVPKHSPPCTTTMENVLSFSMQIHPVPRGSLFAFGAVFIQIFFFFGWRAPSTATHPLHQLSSVPHTAS